MIDIRFEVNGRRVDPRNIGNVLEAAVLQAATSEIQKKVGACRCPEHGEAPKMIGKGRSVDKLNFEISGCCDKLIEEVKRKLS